MTQTKKPTGLKITRDGVNFILSWSKGDKDYGNGQQFQWLKDRASTEDSWGPSPATKLGANTTSRKESISLSNYYPNSEKPKLNSVKMRVRGNRKKYTTGSGKNKKTINPGWSEWNDKTFTIAVPAVPKLTAELDSVLTNKTLFSWETETSTSAAAILTDCFYESIRVPNCDTDDGSKINFDKNDSTYISGTTTATNSLPIEESGMNLSTTSYTRWFRIKARGPKGDNKGGWVYEKHVYARTQQATVEGDAKVEDNTANGMDVYVGWDAPADNARPIDETQAQYVLTVPNAGLACPSGLTWTDADISADTDATDHAAFAIDDQLDDDECLFIRINTRHDTNITYGTPKLSKIGVLKAPSNLSVNTNNTTHKATITATNNSAVPDSFLVVTYRASSGTNIDIGVIVHGSSSVTVQGPNWDEEDAIAFGVRAVVGSATAVTRNDGADGYNVDEKMKSDGILWSGGNVPKAPSNVTAVPTDKKGTIKVGWGWPWSDADGAEIAWSDHADAWESTDEPQLYEIPFLRPSEWNISGLETGMTWYVRVRLFIKSGDDYTYGPWSDIKAVSLAEAPSVPKLTLSAGVITPDGSVNAYWAYSSQDGTHQMYAEICEVTISGGVATYGDVIAHTEAAQQITIKAKDDGHTWSAGSVHYLALRVMSSAGKLSDSWSNIVTIRVAPQLVCSITSTSLTSETITLDGVSIAVKSLKTLPLTVAVSGADEGCETEVAIERAEDFHLERPDGRNFNGYDGETVAQKKVPGGGTIKIEKEDLIGQLDDEAKYRLIVIIRDSLGRAAEATPIDFIVNWTHQALMPEGEVQVDKANYIAIIKPKAPANALSTDRVDIYRLSHGYPELIYPGAEFGKKYVDPYPAIGDMGGHRLVFVTQEGDYKTSVADGHRLAWKDFIEEDGDEMDVPVSIIDFNGQRVELMYDIDLSDKFEKDFENVTYLGGSVQGYFGKSVKRKSDIKASIVTDDEDTIRTLALLCDYSGPAHIRTRDGSSYWANINVQRELMQSTGHNIWKYTFNAERFDPEGYDGVRLEDWK